MFRPTLNNILSVFSANAPEPQCKNDERIIATLLSNQLVAGDREVAEHLLKLGKHRTFLKGKKLIVQNQSDDCIYFLLAGEVNVFVNKKQVDSCRPPSTIGELTADEPENARTADVIASSTMVEVLEVCGSSFRAIRDTNENFSLALSNLIRDMNRKKIIQLGEKQSDKDKWLLGSTLVAIGTSVLAGFYTHHMSSDLAFTSAALVSGGIGGFIMMQLINPAYRYRRIAGLSFISLIILLTFSGVSYQFSVGQNSTQPWLINFNANSHMKIQNLGFTCLILLCVGIICSIADLILSKNDN